MKEGQKSLWVVLLFFISFFVVMSFRYLTGEHVLLTTDAIISGGSRLGMEAVRLFSSNWRDQSLLGLAAGGATQVPTLLKVFTPGVLWNNLSYVLACLLASFALVYYLRTTIQTVSGRILSALAGVWVGSNLTLLYAGHGFKPYVVLFFICSLIPVARVVSGSIPFALIWGSCVGLMFSQQPDVAMFFALFSGAYLIFRLWKAQGFKLLKWTKVLLPAAIVAFLFAAGPLLSGYKHHVKDTTQAQAQNPQEKWDYMTQWSFPPEELIAFVAPGYTGWRSGEAAGPYWGRMGRSPGWEQTRQGFMNFKLENTYLGVIPVAFALFALFSCRRSTHRAEILFWGGAMLVALLLAFGKFSPLYSLFYKLPVVNNIRNPNKFLQVFQVCLAILTAYGFDALFRQKPEDADLRPLISENRRFFWGTVGVLGILGIWAVSLTVDRSGDVRQFMAMGWPQNAAQVIVSNKIAALWHASLMTAIGVAVFALFSFPMLGKALRFKNWVIAGLVLIVAADAMKLSKHYVKEMPSSYIEANTLTEFLHENLGEQRTALLTREGIYNVWLTYLLPYNKIPTFDVAQMPRMSTAYQAFLEAGQRNPLNMWRFSAVKYLLGPSAVEKQLAGQARKVFAYDLVASSAGEFQVVAQPSGAHAVFELLNTSPRYAVVAPIESGSDPQAVQRVTQSPRPQTGVAEVLSYRSGDVALRISAEAPATLRIADQWNEDWHATIDGEPIPVETVDFLCQGIALPEGEHHIVLSYTPDQHFFYMQCVGYLILLMALISRPWKKHDDA